MYWRIVHTRSRYMWRWMPRVKGYSPGRPMSRSKSALTSWGSYTGFTGMPACSRTSFIGWSPSYRLAVRFAYVLASRLAAVRAAGRLGLGPRARGERLNCSSPLGSLGSPCHERLHHVGKRRAHREDPAHADGQQRRDVARRNDPAHDHLDLVRTLRAQSCQHASREGHVSSREDAEADDVHVLLNRLLHDLLGRALEPGVDDLYAGIAQRLGHDLGAAVVAVEPRLGDEDLHAAISSVTRRAVTFVPATIRRAREIGSLNRRGPALPGFR